MVYLTLACTIYCTDLHIVSGSVQSIVGIPDDIKSIFRTAFELDPHDLIDMAVDRSPFIDQSQSLSMFVAQPTPPLLVSSLSRGSFHESHPAFLRWTFNFTHGGLA